jgi:hypothetical protein
MSTFRVTGTTIGEGSAAHVEHWKPYRYKGKPRGWPFDPATHDEDSTPRLPNAGSARRSSDRRMRIAEYCRLRDRKVPEAEAARQVGITGKTAGRYETEWKKLRQRQEVAP